MKGLKDIIGIDYGKLQDELHKEMSESEQNTRERQEQAYMDEARRNAREFDLPTRERTLKDDFAQGFGAFEPARRQLRKDEQVAENLSTDYMAYVGSKDVAKAANEFDLPEMQRNYAISPTRHVGIERSQDFTVDEKQRREVERPTHKSSEYAEARAVRPGERGDDGRIFRRTLGGIMPEARHDTFGFAKIAKSRRDNQAERLANNFNSLLEDAMSFEPGNYNTDQYRAKSDTIAAAEGNLRELVRRERDYDDKLYSFFDTDEGKRVARPILDKYSDDKAREAAKMYDIDEDTAVQRVTAEREKRLQEAFEGSDYYQKWLFGTQYGQAYNALNKAQRLNAAKYLDVDTSKQQKDIDNMNLAQSMDEIKDYYKQELDRLEKEATEKDIKEGWVDENTRRYMLSGGRLSPINMPSENQKTLEAAARAYNDIAETQAEYLREGNTTALGRFFRGAGNAATDKRTWDFGFSHLNDAVELEKAAQAVEQGKATKAQELLVNLSALKNVVTSEYGDVLGGMYGAGRTTTEMLPFMLQMIMTPTTGVIRAATGKIAGVLAKKMGKEAAEKAARFFAEKLTGKVIKTIGKGVQKVAEATERGTVAQALYGMPTTLADTQERMTGMIKAGTSDDGKIVYTGREKGDGLIDAARKSYIANNLEYTTEMLGSLFRPATQAMKRGVKAFTDYATKNGINLSKIYDFFAMTDKKGMVQIWDKFAKKGFYDGPVGEYGEEVINNLGNALLVGDLNFNSPDDPNSVFNPELNLDTFLAVAMGSAFMGGLGRINYGATILQKRAADHRLNAKLENWDRLKDELASKATANDALKEGLERIAYYEKNGSVSHNEAESLKKSLADYAQITWWQKGLDMREEKEQEAAEDTQADNTGTTAQDAATVDVVTAGQGEAVNAGQQPVQSPTDVLTSVNTESMPSAGEAVDVDPGREYRSAGRDFAAAEAELDDRENSNDHNKAAAAQIIKSSSDLFTAQAILNERALDTEDNLALAERYFSSLERSKALEDEMLARANEETDNIIHKDTDSVVEVTDRDGNAGYVISGGVSVEDDGTVSATDDTVMVKSADGTVRQIPAVELQFTTPATSRDDYAHRLQARMQVRNDVPEPVAGIAFTDDDGIRHTVTGVDTAGNIVVSDDLGETTTISRDDYNYFMSNALDKQEEQAQAAGQAEVQPQEYRPVTESATAEQPQNVEHSSTDVQGTGENVPAVEKNVENIQQDEQTGGVGGRKLTGEEAEALVSEMETNAEIAPEVELTPDNWVKEFGENGIVDTPVGKVKIGENQYLKLLKNKRDRYFGMIKPTLTNPDVILEEYDPKEGAERDTKYLFIKTFVKPDGSRVVHFESVTVQKDNLEVSISSHEINEKALTKKVYQNNLIHLNEKFSSSEWRLTEPRNEGSDLVPTPNSVSSESKDNEKPEEIPTDGKGNLLYSEVPVEKTVAYLYNSGLTDEEIQGFIEANIAASREKYERLAQKQPKIGTDIAKYKAKKAQWRSSVDGAKKQYDYWQAVDTYIKEQTHTTEEEVSAARAELEGDNARREYASISGDIQGDAVVTAAQFISDKKITPESFRRETGYRKDEQRRFVGMIASKEKGGESIERLAERLAEDDADNNNGALYHGDDYNAKSAILEALQRYGTRGALKKGEDDMLADKYAEEKAEERDAHYMDAYHMDYADYLAAREQEMPDIWRKYGNFDKDEYYSLYAEEIEQRLKGIENEQRTDSEREEPADDRSDKVLPGERLDDGGGIAESAEPERKGDNGNGSPVPHGYVQEGSSAGEVAEKIAQAEAETDTNPTEAQKEAGNYKKGHVRIDGFDITIENPKGSVRSGVDANGKRWENTMNNTYGYMRGTEGVDGDHIDVFLSDNPEEGNVYVVDQQNPETGEFDEHKVMYGFNNMEEAKEAYLANYTPGWKGLGTITEVSKEEFKKWVESSHRKTKPFAEYKSVKKEDGKNEGENTLANEAHYLFSELISKSTHNVEINDKEVFETENTLYAPINVDGKRTNLSLYQTEPVLSSEEPIVGVSYYRDGLTYQEASDLSEEYNRQAGKTVCMDGDDDLGINFGNIDEAVRFEEWLKYRGTLPVNEAAIRDAVVERLRESGIDVITDTEAGQRVLDEANGKGENVRMQAALNGLKKASDFIISALGGITGQRRAKIEIPQRANRLAEKVIGHPIKSHSININELIHIRKRHGENGTANDINSIPLRDKDIALMPYIMAAPTRVVKGSMSANGTESVRYEKDLGNGVVVVVEREGRFDVEDMENITMWANKKPATNVTVAAKASHSTSETIVISEADAAKIRKDAETAIKNDLKAREHRVYHGSGADFEAFDHSHMGEGEGAQAYGWGSYVTEVEGIGRTYAEERRISETDVDDELATRMADYEADSDSVSEPDYATREHFGIDEPVFLEDGYSVGDADEAKLARQAAIYYGRDIDLENEEDVEEIIDELLGDMTGYYNEEYARRRNEYESNLREELEARQTVHLYTVEIPDDTGENYLDWEKGPTEKQGELIRKALLAELDSRGMRSEENIAGLERQWKMAYEADGRIGGAIYYNIIRRVAGSDKAASELLSKIGFTGISYPAQATTGGRADGARNYVIFDEKDLKITDHVRFFRTENGEAYGFTAGGKIYLDPRMATVETPIHEYSHLWASVLREANPNEWKHIAELLKGTPVWDEVKRRYPELETDDEIADEVLATYSGRRGAERLRDEARKIAEGKGSPIDKAEAVSALRRVREALQRFWKGVADFLHIHYASAEDVADRVMRDLAEGVNPQKSPKGNMQNPAVEKIEDVGEKIGGARKDRFAEYMEKSKQVEDKPESFMEQLRKLPVSKMFNFPLDALRKDGLSNEAATLIDIIRRMIPAKPRSEWKLKRWTENVFRLYRMCLTLGTADKKMLDDILERIQRERIISGMYRAQMALGGFDSGKDTGTARLEQLGDNAGHYDKNGEWVSAKGQWYVSHAGRYGGIYPDFEKAKEVLEKFAGENTKTSGSKKDVQFSVYMSNADKSCFITVKGKPDMVVQSGFKTAKDATNYLNEHIDDLREKYRNFKESTNIGFRPNGERIGKDWRGGKDVAAEDFRKAFGFRGVEFGNWTNQKERQSALNQAYDAFMDLSEATGISPQGLSLGGELGIAFGARGGGKAAAHYESGKVVINLTKTQGAGTLAHEWWHAIDNYFSRRRGHSAGYNTERRDYKLTREDGKLKRTDEKERTEITDAFGELMKAIEESDYGKRSNRYASIKSNYWKDPTELGARAFAVWVERKLSEKGIVDDFLANNNTLGWGSPELTQKYFPYPMESDFESLDTAFDNLFNAIEEKTDEETGNTILYRFIGEKGAARLDAAEEANMKETNERFNEELDKFEKGTMRSSDKFNLGAPSQILLSSGLPNSNIEMTQSVLRGHLVKHGISVNDIKNLPVALQNPIMVYEWGDKARSAVIITDLSLSDGRKVTAAIRVEKNGERLSINEISSIHGKEIERLLNDMNTTKSDFGKDNLKYVDKEKALNWFAMASPKEASQTNSRLLSAANIVENFRNPEIKGENLRDVVAEYGAGNNANDIMRYNAERKKRITDKVKKFANDNGLGEIDIIESADDARVPDRVRREIEGGSVVSGWYDTRTGRVALYYPTVTDEADALRTVAHEAIGHKGLRAVIGEDTYNEFLDYVDKNADEDIAKRINAKESETGNRRVAVDEVLAEIAEREAGEPVHLNLWQRIAGWIRDALRRIGIDTEITVGQAQYYIWRSRRNAGEGGLTDTARDTVMRRKTKAKDVLNISAGMRTAAESEAETLHEVNKRFNEELSGLTEENAHSKILYLGNPGKILLAAGISDKPIKLYGNKLLKKMHKHDFTIAAVKNLPIEINNPIAVFKGSVENSFAMLSELKINGNNVLASLTIGKGNDIEFNIISSIYGKDSNSVVFWINRGKTLYVNKEKALNYLRISAPIAEAQDNQELDSAANIINNFENPETGEENIRFRKSPRQRAIEAADNAVRTYRESAADLYHNTLERSMFRFSEAFQDGMRSVRVLVDSILTSRGESINDLKEYEDAYRAENHCASKSMNEFDQYRNRLYNPVIEAARRVMETSGLDTDGLRHYLFAKSGLERNREFTVRDIYKIADKANDEAQRRYATAKRKVEEAKASDEWKTLTGEEKKELELATSNAEKRADEKKAALDATEAIVNEYRELEERMYLELENGDIGFEEYCDTLDEFVTKRIDKDYDPAKTDYSGFASIFKGEKDYKQAALALVRSIEGDRARRSTAGVNDAFNEALGKLTEENADGVTLMLGRPSEVLRAAGVEDKPMKLYGNKVIKKMKKHGFALAGLKNLPEAVANPIAVFDNYQKEGNRSILTELKTSNGNFLVTIDLGKDADVDFNIVTSVFGKGNNNVVDWINKGYATYINKEKAQEFLSHQSALIAATAANSELDSAANIVENFENPKFEADETGIMAERACNDLWKRIKTATDYLLSKQAEGGLISHSQADMLKKRSNWYVPMRGWNGITTADVYDYVNNWNKTQGRRKEKEAGGRGSEAGDPIAQIIYIAQNTIEEANRNEVKQRFLDFVLNHMSDLATVHPAWVRLNEKGEWEYAAPDIEEGDSAEQIEQKIKTFEANMQAEKEAGRASKINSKARLNVDMVVIPRTEDEHTVLVRRGGRMFTIIINGNPRAAQALNGWLQRQQQGDVARVFNRAMRGIAMLITSKAPNFILRNGMRDFGYAADTLMVREGKDYAARFLKNYAAIIPAREHSIFKLLEKFKEGTLDTEHDDVERMFSEFMLNGAETGYINYQNVEKWRSDIENLLKKDPKGITEKGKKNLKKAWKGTWDYIEKLNRGAEDLVRFATYMTSRQEGRSIFTSVDNAKNVSVNFNRSGAGYNGQGWWRYPAGFMRGWFMFFNAGVQGLTNFLYNFKAAPGRSTARAIARGIAGSIVPYFTLGFLNGLLHGLYGGDDGDDDGKDGYFDLTDYTRRTNFIIGGFCDYYIMLPLPIELRAFYGAGEAFAGVLTGKQHAEDVTLSAVASLFELLPVNPVEMYKNPANLAGGVFSPIAQAVMNENFMGVPLYKDTPWNEEAPAYTKAYAGTPKILVDISRSINELTGGNEYKTGWLGKADNVINNPAITYHLLRSYLGGVAQVFGQVFNLMGDYIVPNAETAITGEGEYNTDRIFREIPFFSVLVTQNDERTGYSLTNKLYHDMKEQADRRKDLLGKYFADGNKQEEINEMLEDSKANAKDDVILFYDGILKDLNEQAKGSTEEESEQIKITINKVRKAAVLNASEAAGEPLTLNMPQTRLQEQLGTGEAYIAEHMTIPDALEEGELRRLKSQASKNPNTIKNKITLTIIRRYESFKRKMSDAMEYSDDMGYNLNTIREARKGMLEYLRGM